MWVLIFGVPMGTMRAPWVPSTLYRVQLSTVSVGP
jgi:hypothetical protein